MRASLPPLLAVSLALASASVVARARAEPPSVDRKRAAAAFDEGVARYDRAEFAEAARAFLEADRRSPSAVAISNVLGAAKRAGDHLLVARTAEKAIARGDVVVEARAALADAATRLGRLELACEVTPCTLTLDGEPAEGSGPRAAGGNVVYVLPGTHRIEAHGAGATAGAAAEERVVCIAGATYRIALHPVAHTDVVEPPRASYARLPPAVFIAAAGITAVLAAVSVWSGVDAVSSKNALPGSPTQPQEDDVLARARRTDYLWLGAGLAGAATVVIGGFLTAWHRPAPAAAALVLIPGGAVARVGGDF